MLPSCAVTVYVTGFVKSWATVDAGGTVASGEIVIVGTRPVTFVPFGTIALIFVPLTVPVTSGLRPPNENPVMSFALLLLLLGLFHFHINLEANCHKLFYTINKESFSQIIH